jgi:hypothetical protein
MEPRRGTTETRSPLRGNVRKLVRAGQGQQIQDIQRVIVTAARGVLPVWKTTPIPTILRDAGLPAAKVALDAARLRLAYRLATVDRQHPLHFRQYRELANRGPLTG